MMGGVVNYNNIVDRTIVSILQLVLSLQSTYLIKHSI